MMQINDIRPADLMERQKAAYERDAAWLDKHCHQYVDANCPACGDRDFNDFFQAGIYIYSDCSTCQTLYTHNRPTPALLAEYYARSENYETWATDIFPASEPHRQEIARDRAATLAAWMTRTGCGHEALIDIGAGFGTFLRAVQEQNLCRTVAAIEPTPSLAAHLTDFHNYKMPIEAVTDEQPGQLYDVVTAFEVIEHLFNPSRLASAARILLRPGGLLMLTCPNAASLEVQVKGAESAALDVEHLNIFTPKGLSILLEAHGFEVLEWTTPGKLDAELLGLPIEYQQAIRDLRVSSHLQIIARKGP